MEALKKYAHDRVLKGGLSYELSMHGPAYALEEFCRQFGDKLELVYPAYRINGIHLEDGEVAVHIVSFKDVEPTHLNREAIIDMIHHSIGVNLWHGSWRTAIGRS